LISVHNGLKRLQIALDFTFSKALNYLKLIQTVEPNSVSKTLKRNMNHQ